MVQRGTKSEQCNIRRVTPFFNNRTSIVINSVLYVLSPSPIQHLCLNSPVTDFSVHYTSHMNLRGYLLPHEDFFRCSHPDPPFMGTSDIGQESALFSTHRS